MEYIYKDISYNKRALTDDISLRVIGNDISVINEKRDEYIRLALPYKSGELAGQADSCPVQKAEDLLDYVVLLKSKFEGFRIRNSQLSGIIAVNGSIKKDDVTSAAFYIAGGGIAVIAGEYEDGADIDLLLNGIIPLRSDEEIKAGTFIFIRNIRRDILSGSLESYIVTKAELKPINIYIDRYDSIILKDILE